MNSYGFNTILWTDIFPNVEEFLDKYKNIGITPTITEENATLLYYLMYARFGNSHIMSTDRERFTYKLFSTVFMYGPSWEARLTLQSRIRELLKDDKKLMTGLTQIYNDAYNNDTNPTTQTTEELEYINAQKVAKVKNSYLSAYSALNDLILTDVTKMFLDKFDDLFIKILRPQKPYWYITDNDEEEEDE